MIAAELINHMVPPLKVTDDAHKAIVWMEEFRCNYLPVTDEGHLLGFISEEIILEANDIEKGVGSFNLVGKDCVVSLDAHFFDILRIAGEHKLNMVAVNNEEGQYAGVITVQDIMASFAQTASVQMPGGILVLSMELIDYSLAEISRYVEENKAKVISSTMVEDPLDRGKIKLTIKINQLDLSRIVATLERFGYRVIGRYQEAPRDDDDKERLDMLMKYLNM
ncbi:MAG: CBS domain-containing protein [Cyclobacteriaceae bacterium]|jgi:CBS domain-containing protein|nr:CBS domain-containing protein [Cyclobacteriaceae bacterium]HQQ82426.1 CBS domain-containing protein [Cyclobacteriaceae bacterium]